MAATYAMMIRTAGQVQAALLATTINTAARCVGFTAKSCGNLARGAGRPLAASPECRQNAIEDLAWTALCEQRLLLRGATGLTRLSVLTFMNELDRRRGDKPVPPALLGGSGR